MWYLVLELDHTNRVAERPEDNNKAVWSRRLQVFP